MLLEIFVDADGCPVRDEIYRVAKRYELKVNLVANARLWVPTAGWLELILVDGRLDAADDWIAEHISANDIAITGDIPLAERCLAKEALVLSPTGRIFDDSSIGDALATRQLLSHLRETGAVTGGPAPLKKRDRSKFLQRLDEMIQSVRRNK